MNEPIPELPQQSLPEVPQSPTPVKRKTPVMGILSFAFGVIPILIMVILFKYENTGMETSFTGRILVDLRLFVPVFGGLFFNLSLIFGIIGLFQKDRSKVFAIIGTVIGCLYVLVSTAINFRIIFHH